MAEQDIYKPENPVTYEEMFASLPTEERREKLYEQIEVSARMTMNLHKYFEHNMETMDRMEDEKLFPLLCIVAFETNNDDEINSKYALSQREGFKLSIANFLENRHKILGYRKECADDPKKFAEKYLEKKFVDNVEIEQLPTGFVIFLNEKDYALMDNDKGDPKKISSKGRFLATTTLEHDLKDKLIVINKGSVKEPVSNIDLFLTKEHEMSHLLYAQFHQQEHSVDLSNAFNEMKNYKEVEDYTHLSHLLSKTIVEEAKDEIVAYFVNISFHVPYTTALRFDYYVGLLKTVKRSIRDNKSLSDENKILLLKNIREDKIDAFNKVRKIRVVSQYLFVKKSGEKPFVEALLRNTPGKHIERLSRQYGDIDLDSKIKEKNNKLIVDFENVLPIPSDKEAMKRLEKLNSVALLFNKLTIFLPKEILPTLLKCVPKWNNNVDVSPYVGTLLTNIESIAKIYDLNKNDKQIVLETINMLSQDINIFYEDNLPDEDDFKYISNIEYIRKTDSYKQRLTQSYINRLRMLV